MSHVLLTEEQAQQIDEIIEHLLVSHPTARHHKACVEALSIIRAARAQERQPKKWIDLTSEEYEMLCQGSAPLSMRVRTVAMALKNKNLWDCK